MLIAFDKLLDASLDEDSLQVEYVFFFVLLEPSIFPFESFHLLNFLLMNLEGPNQLCNGHRFQVLHNPLSCYLRSPLSGQASLNFVNIIIVIKSFVKIT